VLIGWFAALPFPYTFAAGAIAGCTELLCLYPLGMSGDCKRKCTLMVGGRYYQDPDAARDGQGTAWNRRYAEGDRRQGRVSCEPLPEDHPLIVLQSFETLPWNHPSLDVGSSQASHQMYVPRVFNSPASTFADHSPQSLPTRTGATPSPTAAPNL
jgi:hypothetical protein